MKYIVALLMVCAGLGLDAGGNSNLEIALGLSFFFGSIQLVVPASNLLMGISGALFKRSAQPAKS